MNLRSLKQNSAAVTAIIITFWSLWNFFHFQIAPVSDKLPDKIKKIIQQNPAPVFLSSQLLDKLVLNHPELNIFPGGGNTLQYASSFGSFYIADKYQALDCIDINHELNSETVGESDGFKLKRCTLEGHINVITASSMIENLKVRVEGMNSDIPYKNERFRTGHSGWQKIEAGAGEFGDQHRFAISAHPLPDNKIIEITVLPPDRVISKMVLGAGISNSGKQKGSKPVMITATQNELKKEMKTVDGRWIENELTGFSADEPVKLIISTKKSGKRHFYFDLFYFESAQ